MTESSVGSRLTALNVARSGADVAVQPEPGDRERRGQGQRLDLRGQLGCRGRERRGRRRAARAARPGRGRAPGAGCAAAGRRPSSTRQRVPASGVIERAAVPVRTAVPRCVEVAGERVPDAAQVVGVRGVEADALRVAQEVVVEHRDQLAGRQLRRAREEGPRERLEQHRLRPVGHPQRGQELGGRHAVEAGGGALRVVGQQLGGQPPVGAEQVAQAEAGGAGEQGDQVQRRARPAARSGPPAASCREITG